MCDTNVIPYEKYVSLHTHSNFSTDGYGPWETMVQRAKELGQNYIACTDHGTLSNIVRHWTVCTDNDINPIFGVEGYMSLDPTAKKVVTNHITILARNETGFRNLVGLNNRSHEQMIQKRNMKFPLMTFADFKEFRDGLIILTGCPASLTYHEDYDVAASYVERLVKIFGDENVFTELMFVLEGQDFHTRPLQLAAELGIRSVITNDTHYTFACDAKDDMAALSIRSRAQTGTDYSYDNERLFLMSGEQIAEYALKSVPEEVVIDCFNTIDTITQSIKPVDLRHDVVVPYVSEEELDKFKELIRQKLDEYCTNNPEREQEARSRYATEVSVIDGFDFWSYFYIVNDMVYFCQTNNIMSTARGSAAGSFIIYLLGICKVDPLRYGLLFERFLNTARNDYPDIDLDVSSVHRHRLVEYSKERWGLQNVNTIITFGHKSLVRDLARYFSHSPKITNHLANIGPGSEEFAAFCDENPEFTRMYDMLIGQPKTVGTHAAAIASIKNELPIPIERWNSSGTPGIALSEAGSSHELSFIGGLKFDVLGLRTLSILEMLYEVTGVLPPHHIDDDFAAEIFENATLGLFQFDGSLGIQQMCKDIKPKDLNEAATINSMYRPGALDAGTAEHYMEYKKKPRKFSPAIDRILEDTYSVIVYQEEVMGIYAEVTGEGLEGADIARRTLSPKSVKVLHDPKWQQSIKEIEQVFLTKGQERGYELEVLEKLWAELFTHSRYSFNKAHSISYADLAARQAWYKKYYPKEMYLCTLNTLLADGQNYKMQEYIWAMYLEGFELRPPHVVKSSTQFELKDGKIYLPITTVKYVSDRSLDALQYLKAFIAGTVADFDVEASINSANYYDSLRNRLIEHNVTEITFESLALLSAGHVWNKRAKLNLYRIGAFEDIPGDISALLDTENITEISRLIDYVECMDMTLPNELLLTHHKNAQKRGYTFGIITQKFSKTTKSGVNIIGFSLTGNQTIRIYESKKDSIADIPLVVGMPVLAKTNQYSYLEYHGRKPRIKCIT